MYATSTAPESISPNVIDVEKEGQRGGLSSPKIPFPDGGLRAWLVVLGAFCTNMSTFGFINAWGVFQAYYEQTLLSNRSPADIAWIGSVQCAFGLLPSLLIGRLFDLGHFERPLLLGSIGLVTSTILIAQCKEHWQFIVVQGIIVGTMSGICFGSIFAVVGQWFKNKRGSALCCTCMGASVGATFIPVAVRELISRVGFPWTMRILGCMILGLLGVGNLTMRRRLPPEDVAGSLFRPNASASQSPAFTIYCAATLVMYTGINNVPTFIDSSALSAGVSARSTFYCVSTVNFCSTACRVATALLVDKLGAINMMVPTASIAAVIACMWPHARTEKSLFLVAAAYGFSSGTWFSNFTVPACSLGRIEDSGRRIGMMLTVASVGAAAGPPISGAIIRMAKGYVFAGYYTGTMMLLSCCLALATRHFHLKSLSGRF